MKKIIYTVLCAGLMFGVSSCQKDYTAGSETEGGVTISANVEDVLASRAIDAETLKNNAQVKIYMPAYAGLAREYTYSDMPDVVYLPAGTGYRVDVVAGEHVNTSPAIASFENKSYKGSASFDVTAGVVNASPITVNAKICNAITNATLDSSIDEAFEDGYKLTIGLDGNNLEYTAANSGADGYFIIADNALSPKLAWSFSGTLTKNGEAFTKNGEFEVAQGKKYTMNLIYIEKEGILTVNILVDKSTNNYNDQITFEPTSSGISSSRKYEFWATHATVHADVDLATYDESKVFFQYRKSGEEAWTMSDTATKVSEDGAFDAVLSGLTPETTYEYQLVVFNTEAQAEEVVPGENTFTTAAAPVLPNASFEDYNDSGDFDLFYNSTEKWWDCGNQYAPVIQTPIEVTTSSTDIPDPASVEGGYAIPSPNTRSARLKSQLQMGTALAAGNLYSGNYGGTNISPMYGWVYFGRPFTGRPTAIRMYVKYTTSTIDQVGDNAPSGITKNETMDRAQIKAVLGDWNYTTYGGIADSPVCANTKDPNAIVDFAVDGAARKAGDETKGTIAYGTAIIDGAGPVTINGVAASKTYTDYNSWQVLTIPIEYYDTKSIPTHIIVSFTAGAWGDYFTGSTSSDLYIDAVELVYDENVTIK